MNIETSLTIIAIAIIVLSILAIAALYFLIQLLSALRTATKSVELKVKPILEEAHRIVNLTGSTTEMIYDNIALTKPFFHSVGKISSLVEDFPNRFKNNTHEGNITLNLGAKKDKVDFGDWAEWLALSAALIQRLRHK